MEGRNVEATKAARDLTNTITEEEARKDRWKELYLPTPIFSTDSVWTVGRVACVNRRRPRDCG